MNVFSIQLELINILGYSLSYVEAIGVITGIISVWLMTRGNIWGWAVGLINIICFFSIFYQIKLYPDMFLQIYFFCINCLGLIWWSKKEVHEEDFGVKILNGKQRALVFMSLFSGTILCGIFAQNTHVLLPQFFPGPSDYPFLDSFIAVSSVTASLLLLKKYFENWFLWMILDVCCVALYLTKGIYFISAEYVIYFILSAIGFLGWLKMHNLKNKAKETI